ncbi:MAG: tail fiber domain-containing protein [Rhodobacter sp.]|nr:tail fiber domain-containing protein [Rhodobacter sp.]
MVWDFIKGVASEVGGALGLGGGTDAPEFYDPRKDFKDGGLIDFSAYDAIGRPEEGSERWRLERGDQRTMAGETRAIDALTNLGQRASGQNLVAQMEADRQQKALASQISARAAGATNPAALRSAMYAQGQMGADLAARGAAEAAKERMAAERAYMSSAADMYGRQLGAEQMRRGLGLDLAEGNRKAQMQLQQNRINMANRQQATQGQMHTESEKLKHEKLKTAANMAASAAAGGSLPKPPTSDIRSKENIRPGDGDVSEMLDSLSPYSFDYKKGQGDGGSDKVGIMAQDLASTPAGRGAVIRGEDGKLAIDSGQASTMALAAAASLNDRLKNIEGKTGGRLLSDHSGVLDPPPRQIPEDMKTVPMGLKRQIDDVVADGRMRRDRPGLGDEHPAMRYMQESIAKDDLQRMGSGKRILRSLNNPNEVQDSADIFKKMREALDNEEMQEALNTNLFDEMG